MSNNLISDVEKREQINTDVNNLYKEYVKELEIKVKQDEKVESLYNEMEGLNSKKRVLNEKIKSHQELQDLETENKISTLKTENDMKLAEEQQKIAQLQEESNRQFWMYNIILFIVILVLVAYMNRRYILNYLLTCDLQELV